MPYLKIQTNQQIAQQDEVIKKVSGIIASQLGKSEKYVMVALEPDFRMSFAGSTEPAAFLQLKSIGLPESRTKEISSTLCGFLEKELGIPQNRIYIEFTDVERSYWGWNGSTF